MNMCYFFRCSFNIQIPTHNKEEADKKLEQLFERLEHENMEMIETEFVNAFYYEDDFDSKTGR